VSKNPKIHSLQALRAVAASLVVIDHTLLELSDNAPSNYLTKIAYILGNTGVYSFFALSGFIMVFVSWSGFGGVSASINFFWRRMIRIAPLYWIGTLAALGFHKVSATHGAQDSWRELAYSVAFIPYRGSDGAWSPILPQGWTLNYEMMFYVIFALGLCIPRKFGLPIVCAVLLTLVLVGGQSGSPVITYLASPIVLWFLLGIALAIIWKYWELSEPTWIGKSAERLEPIGDASYSLYLVHGFVLTMVLRFWVGAGGSPSLWLVPASLVVAIVAGWVIYVAIERPLLGLLSGKNKIKSLRARTTKSATSVLEGGPASIRHNI
jgi:exopolysaccharide production protein ExoZ